MAPTTVAGFPVVVSTAAFPTVTFTLPAVPDGAVIVLVATSDGSISAPSGTAGQYDSGWTLLDTQSAVGTVSTYTKTKAGARSAGDSITLTVGDWSNGVVYAYTGSLGVGAHTSANGTTGPAVIATITPQANSALVGGGVNNTSAPSYSGNNAQDYTASNSRIRWGQRYVGSVTGAAITDFGTTAPTGAVTWEIAVVEVLDAPTAVSGVKVPSTANVGVGCSQALTATVIPISALDQTVTWTVVEASSGTLDSASANPVTYTAPGSMGGYPATVHVRVTTTDGGFQATTTVTIPNPVSGPGPWPAVFAGRFDVVDAI